MIDMEKMSNSGIRADSTVRAVTLSKETNYKTWSVKTKAASFMLDCWDIANGTATMPPNASAGSTADQVDTVATVKSVYTKKFQKAAAININTISDDQVHSVQTMYEDPVAIWNRLREKSERVSEAQAENARMRLLDFAQNEGETANATIDRFDAAIKYCADQGVNVDDNHGKRILLARPNDYLSS